jgi:hypothetical protein
VLFTAPLDKSIAWSSPATPVAISPSRAPAACRLRRGVDAFVAWIDPASSGDASLLSSTYFGGEGIDVGYAVAADARGRAFVTGYSASTNIPVTDGGFTTALSGLYDAFLSAIDF